MEEKVFARIKHKPEDFIVEEFEEHWKCSVAKSFDPNKPTDISNLHMNEKADFVCCELEKKDIDHFQAIKEVAMMLNKDNMSIGYAGTKDRFAHTVQRISIFNPDLEALQRFNHSRIILKNFKWAKRKIKLGYLDGNKFTITLREVEKKDAIKVSNALRKHTWFPNYFGEQRFGSLRNNNVEIGKAILKK